MLQNLSQSLTLIGLAWPGIKDVTMSELNHTILKKWTTTERQEMLDAQGIKMPF